MRARAPRAGTGVSLAYLSRLFKASGVPGVAATLRRVRLDDARRLLRTSPLSIKEVAHAAGFRSVKQFERAFRHAHGRAPSEWRRQVTPIAG